MRGKGLTIQLCFVLAGCTGVLAASSPDAGAPIGADAAEPSADAAGADTDAAWPTRDSGAPPQEEGIAPPGAIEGEIEIVDGDHAVMLDGERPAMTFRVDAREHVTFFLSFEDRFADVTLEVLRWDGQAAVSLGITDGGRGVRSLAAFDPEGPRTYWARVATAEPELAATLTVTRAPFQDGIMCIEDCARLMQLPLPNDPARDGYSLEGSIFRYQYGRRELVMFVRYAGRRVASLGMGPFVVGDLSQWDGETPGTDNGWLRHGSHDGGADVDLALYGSDGRSVWRRYCQVRELPEGGYECIEGTARGYDGVANAILLGAFYESGRVRQSFLDRELIPLMIDGAEEAVEMGSVDASVLPLYSSGVQLQHWRNHHNHIHVRLFQEDASASAFMWGPRVPEPIEPP